MTKDIRHGTDTQKDSKKESYKIQQGRKVIPFHHNQGTCNDSIDCIENHKQSIGTVAKTPYEHYNQTRSCRCCGSSTSTANGKNHARTGLSQIAGWSNETSTSPAILRQSSFIFINFNLDDLTTRKPAYGCMRNFMNRSGEAKWFPPLAILLPSTRGRDIKKLAVLHCNMMTNHRYHHHHHHH